MNRWLMLIALFLVGTLACQSPPVVNSQAEPEENLMRATFAGGCFWAMQPPFDELDGVHLVQVGYMGGQMAHPTFQEVVQGKTSHLEVVDIRFDPDIISYPELLSIFWKNIDPTDPDGQFADQGPNYRTAIFFHDDHQRRAAEESRDQLQRSGRFDSPLVTTIRPAETFWIAETYHQDYYKKKPDHYNRYYPASGRLRFIEEVWSEDAHPPGP